MKKIMSFIVLFYCLMFSSVSFAIFSERLVQDARGQIGKTLYYDPAYTKLNYPMGDVPVVKGVCTDVVIRALRQQGIDLQQKIHEDMKANFAAYPKKWGLKSTDRNIDHRRVPNIMTYFKRKNYQVNDQNFRAGDIVTWDLGKGLVHIGIVSDKHAALSKVPLIIHNIGRGTEESNILHEYKIIGHYRIP